MNLEKAVFLLGLVYKLAVRTTHILLLLSFFITLLWLLLFSHTFKIFPARSYESFLLLLVKLFLGIIPLVILFSVFLIPPLLLWAFRDSIDQQLEYWNFVKNWKEHLKVFLYVFGIMVSIGISVNLSQLSLSIFLKSVKLATIIAIVSLLISTTAHKFSLPARIIFSFLSSILLLVMAVLFSKYSDQPNELLMFGALAIITIFFYPILRIQLFLIKREALPFGCLRWELCILFCL